MAYSIVMVGIPSALGLIWVFRGNGGPLFWLFLGVAAFLASILWGVVMWEFFGAWFPHSVGEDTEDS